MKKSGFLLLIGMAVLVVFAGCEDKKPSAGPDGHPDMQAAAISPRLKGSVLRVLEAGSFTYIEVQTESGGVWVAAPQFEVQAGTEVIVPEGRLMADFYSKRLNRTFEKVFFVAGVLTEGDVAGAAGEISAPAMPWTSKMPSMPVMESAGPQLPVDFSGIERIEGGQTISELYAGKQNFIDKPVRVRGRVVKLRTNIMGKNWFHVQDGSGSEKDLTVTSQDIAEVGDAVVVSGTLVADRDFGLGRTYELAVEDGRVEKED